MHKNLTAEVFDTLPEIQNTIVEHPEKDQIQAYVLTVVSEKTGYPVEMLDLELDLEADLGIDTVKQAELFAAIRTHYGIPRREDLRLSEYNTLLKVIGFVVENINQDQPSVESVLVNQPAQFNTTSTTGVAQIAEIKIQPEVKAEVELTQNSLSSTEIQQYVLSVVSEKTGYPGEMLDLELDLEADLGIDTVKQAELFAAIRTNYEIPRKEDLRLSEYNTLSKVIGFVVDNLSSAVVAEPEMPKNQEELTEPIKGIDILTEPNLSIRRRVPVPVLRPRLDLCIPSGIEIGIASRILIVKDSGKTADTLARKLKAKGAQVFVTVGKEAISKAIEWTESGQIQGVYYLSGLDADPEWSDLDLTKWHTSIEEHVETLFTLMQTLQDKTFLITATRMGGLMGLVNPSNPIGGTISGFTKALSRERSNTLIKTIDFEGGATAAIVSSRLLDETLQ